MTNSTNITAPTADSLATRLLVPEEETQEGEVVHRTAPSSNIMAMSPSFLAAVSIGALPMLLFGFNTGVLNAPEKVIFPGHSVGSWSLAVSAFCVGGFFGSLKSGVWADQYGRRLGLLTILALNAFFGMLHVVTPSMGILVIARIGVGLAGGASTVLTPMYLSEIAPADIKGSIGTLTQLSCVLGILVSILYALPFCTEHLWRWIFVPIPAVSLTGVALGYFFLPESPRYLLLHHYTTRSHEAREIIRQFRNLAETEEDEEAVEMEVLLMTNHGNGSNDASSSNTGGGQEAATNNNETLEEIESTPTASFRDFALHPNNRIPLASSILFPIAQQLSGINAVFYYSTGFFEGVIDNPQTGTVLAFGINVVATLVALALMDKLGRKTLLTISAGGMGLCCIILTMSMNGILPGIITVVCVMMYISFFEVGLGCIPFFLASELIPPHYLGTVQSISMASNWFSNFCVGLLFPYMDKFLGPFSFVPFAIVLTGTVLYAVWILPETRGKSLQQVMEELRARQPQLVPGGEEEAES